MVPRLRNSSRTCAEGERLAVQVRRMTRLLWAGARAILAAWRQRREAARIYAELSKLSDDDLRHCRLERRDLYWRALDMAGRYAFACGGRRRRTSPLSAADGKAKPPKADRESEAERRRTAAALRMTVEDAAAALAANQRPHYAFEQELARHIRRLIWLDLAKALFGSSLSPGRPRMGLFRPRPALVSRPGRPLASRQSDSETRG
jgi:hypothetical protein